MSLCGESTGVRALRTVVVVSWAVVVVSGFKAAHLPPRTSSVVFLSPSRQLVSSNANSNCKRRGDFSRRRFASSNFIDPCRRLDSTLWSSTDDESASDGGEGSAAGEESSEKAKKKSLAKSFRDALTGINKNDEGLTFRQKLGKMGLAAVLSYGWVSNMSYCVTVSIAWFIFSKRVRRRFPCCNVSYSEAVHHCYSSLHLSSLFHFSQTGKSPLAPGQWKGTHQLSFPSEEAWVLVYANISLFFPHSITISCRFADAKRILGRVRWLLGFQ